MKSARTAVTRRTFLRQTAFGTACLILPGSILGRGQGSPNERLNIACVGAGGRARANINGCKSENYVAFCDVDAVRGAEALRSYPRARGFQDFRVMLDKAESEIDAVIVSTPDHTHAVAVMAAIGLGKHVYCEKPLAHSLHEVRTITEAAREKRVATQLGNQGHSSDSIRQCREMIQGGAIGTVREVHAWCGNSYRPRGYQLRPADRPPVPNTLNWDLWLGPAQWRPYHPIYLPGKWRGWVPFGTGIVGDWTCHVLDPAFWALDLGSPTSVLARAMDYQDPRVRAETYPPSNHITYEFPAKGPRPPVTVHWYSGQTAPRPLELEPQRQLPRIGAIIVGDRGKIMHGSHGAGGVQIIPQARDNAYQRPPRTIPRSQGHHRDWILACKGREPASSNFNYGGPLSEVAMLGIAALRLNGQPLQWDGKAMQFTNNPIANALVKPPYREGWSL